MPCPNRLSFVHPFPGSDLRIRRMRDKIWGKRQGKRCGGPTGVCNNERRTLCVCEDPHLWEPPNGMFGQVGRQNAQYPVVYFGVKM